VRGGGGRCGATGAAGTLSSTAQPHAAPPGTRPEAPASHRLYRYHRSIPGPGTRRAGQALARTADLAIVRLRSEPCRRALEQPDRVFEDRICWAISMSGAPEHEGVKHGRRTVMGAAEQVEREGEVIALTARARQVDGALPDNLRGLERPHHGRRSHGTGRDPSRGDRGHRLGPPWRRPATGPPSRAARQGGQSHQSGIAAGWRAGSPSNTERQRPHWRGRGSAASPVIGTAASSPGTPAEDGGGSVADTVLLGSVLRRGVDPGRYGKRTVRRNGDPTK
jgi:hypothetical protein